LLGIHTTQQSIYLTFQQQSLILPPFKNKQNENSIKFSLLLKSIKNHPEAKSIKKYYASYSQVHLLLLQLDDQLRLAGYVPELESIL